MKNSEKDQIGYVMPIGGIIIWSGNSSLFDSSGKGIDAMIGWALCNGENNTPNLQNHFVLGAANDAQVNNTGGQSNISIGLQNLPSHTHTIYSTQGGFGNLGLGLQAEDGSPHVPFVLSTSAFGTQATDPTGGDVPIDIMPPFVQLYYIMKIA